MKGLVAKKEPSCMINKGVNMVNKKKFSYFIILIFILLVVLSSILYVKTNEVYQSYIKFCENVQQENIESVKFGDEKIYYTLKGEDKTYYTDNPDSNNLKEKLLLKGIKIESEVNYGDVVTGIFDILFSVIFIAIIYIGYTKVTGKKNFKVVRNVKTKFDDVVGMEKLKDDMKQIVDIMKNQEKYAKKGIKAPKGIILEGKPGNGKTLFARALAGEMKINFIPTKATDFESAVMAIGPYKIKSLFKLARKVAPCIIFIDEFDGIGTKRNYSGNAAEVENTRLVTALLNELDGFLENSGILVIAATNNQKVLDEALVRPGRFDRKYIVSCPNFDERIKLIELYSRSKSFDDDVSIKSLADRFDKKSSSEIATIINEAIIISEKLSTEKITNECINEAMKFVSIT